MIHRFQEEAKSKGIELPSVFTDLDPDSGMPTMFNAATAQHAEKCVIKANEERQKQQPLIKLNQLVDLGVQVNERMLQVTFLLFR